MEPYLSWICPKNTPRPNDPWCNTTQEQLENGQSKSWPDNRPPFAPIGGWTAVVDGSFSGLPDTPYRMMQRGQINLNPQGEPLQIIMGTNQDEMALFGKRRQLNLERAAGRVFAGFEEADIAFPVTYKYEPGTAPKADLRAAGVELGTTYPRPIFNHKTKSKDNIARFKRPKDYLLVDDLPKNNYGKILKTELRKLAARAAD